MRRCVECRGPATTYRGLAYCSTFSCGWREEPDLEPDLDGDDDPSVMEDRYEKGLGRWAFDG